MNKKSGQDAISPPEEKIELIATGMIGSVLAAMEKKILKAIEAYEMPISATISTPKSAKPKTEEEKRVDKVNTERLDEFRKLKEKQNAR